MSIGCESMIRSMTGFGRKEAVAGEVSLTVEMRAVNHRFCEVVVRLPKAYAVLEDHVKKIVSKKVLRGRVDVTILIDQQTSAELSQVIDWEQARHYVQLSRQASERFALPGELSVKELLMLPGVLVEESPQQISPEQLADLLGPLVHDAVEDLVQMKEREGARLLSDITHRLSMIERCAKEIHSLSPLVAEEYRGRLLSRINEWQSELKQEFDQQRILQEILLFAERSDITEEITRLTSHCQEFGQQLANEDAVGRRLDFLLQEMNREANTIAAKANHLGISHLAVEIKTELEKIREQVQNIE